MDSTELPVSCEMKDPLKPTLSSIFDRMANLPQFANCRPLEPRSRGAFGDTPLHVAAVWGDADAVATLLEAGAEIDAQGEHGYTPLHEAVDQGHTSVVRSLLAKGASSDLRNSDGLTPLQLAKELRNEQIIQAFKSA